MAIFVPSKSKNNLDLERILVILLSLGINNFFYCIKGHVLIDDPFVFFSTGISPEPAPAYRRNALMSCKQVEGA